MEQKQTSKSINKWIVSAVVVAVIALVTVAVVPQVVQAQDVTPTTPQDSETTTQDSDTATEQVPPPGRREFGMPEPGRHGRFVSDSEYQALVAEALGISVEELQAAYEQADKAALEQAVANGDITAEQAEMIQAQEALRSYLDKDALMAQALGITVEELQAARDAGKSTATLLDELGLTAAEVQTALQAAYEQAIQQAVSDGVITQAQADTILAENHGFRLPGFDKGGRGRHGGFPGMPDDSTAPSVETSPIGGL